jgi:Tol biopolymer transport system component
VSISPDGSTVAFFGVRPGVPSRIWVRPLGDEAAREVPGTDGAQSMFWSPDGRTLAFFAAGQLKRLDLPGGTPVKVCDVPVNIGVSGTWGRQGDILFATVNGDRISRVPAAGGVPVDVLVASQNAARLLWPRYLADGRRFIYTEFTGNVQGRIMLATPDGSSTPVVDAMSQAQWIEPPANQAHSTMAEQ